MERKAELRTRVLAARRALSEEERRAAAAAAQAALAMHPVWTAARAVALYRPLRSEVDTAALLEDARRAGKRVAFPRLDPRGANLEWVERLGESPFVPHALGFEHLADGPLVPLAELELVVVPGVAFDPSGTRLGMGKGYYDRAIAACSRRPVTVGFAYALQVMEQVPREPHDVRMDWLATEAGVTACVREPEPSA